MPALPYRIAVLCYLFDDQGRVLLLHRVKPPNRDLYSPIGGKLDVDSGESPTACAIREIEEETGLVIPPQRVHLSGMVSESGFDQAMHWLMFLFEVQGPVQVARQSFEEGRLEWHAPSQVPMLAIPQTDRDVIWPLFWRYRHRFFAAHIRCEQQRLQWRIEQPICDASSDWHLGAAAQPA